MSKFTLPKRSRTIRIPVTDEELAQAHAIALDAKLQMSECVRRLIRDAFDKQQERERRAEERAERRSPLGGHY